MSVVKSKKKQSTLRAVLLSVELLQKTIDICSSKNNFPIRKKWAIPSDLYLEAREFCVKLNLANDIKVQTKAAAEERLKLAAEAEKHIRRYNILANTAVLIYPLGETVINSWIGLSNETYELFMKWHKAELVRYTDLINGNSC